MLQNTSFFLSYANRKFFEGMLAEGFTEISCAASRRWCFGTWVIALFVFHGKPPKKESMPFIQVPTWQVLKKNNHKDVGLYDFPPPHEERYSESAFSIFIRRHDLRLGDRIPLAEIIPLLDAIPEDVFTDNIKLLPA